MYEILLEQNLIFIDVMHQGGFNTIPIRTTFSENIFHPVDRITLYFSGTKVLNWTLHHHLNLFWHISPPSTCYPNLSDYQHHPTFINGISLNTSPFKQPAVLSLTTVVYQPSAWTVPSNLPVISWFFIPRIPAWRRRSLPLTAASVAGGYHFYHH